MTSSKACSVLMPACSFCHDNNRTSMQVLLVGPDEQAIILTHHMHRLMLWPAG
jgi:hypothetical protein